MISSVWATLNQFYSLLLTSRHLQMPILFIHTVRYNILPNKGKINIPKMEICLVWWRDSGWSWGLTRSMLTLYLVAQSCMSALDTPAMFTKPCSTRPGHQDHGSWSSQSEHVRYLWHRILHQDEMLLRGQCLETELPGSMQGQSL